MSDRVVLVTGGTRGIGQRIAQAFRREGATVWITGTSEDSLARAREGFDAEVRSVVLDVTSDRSVEGAVSAVLAASGRVDVLVNNAGIGGGGRTAEAPPDHWFRILDTNLHGVYRMTREILRRSGMIERGWGRIINIASTGGKQGVVMAAAYTASKHGVVGFSKSVGLELARTGVTVNALCPGFVETDLAVHARETYARVWGVTVDEVRARHEGRIPIGRYVLPEEVAPLAVYLASDAAAAVTAQAINICGGLGNY